MKCISFFIVCILVLFFSRSFPTQNQDVVQLTLQDFPVELQAHILEYLPIAKKIKEFYLSIEWYMIKTILRDIRLLPTQVLRNLARKKLELRFNDKVDVHIKKGMERYAKAIKFTPIKLNNMNFSQRIFIRTFAWHQASMEDACHVEKKSKDGYCFVHTGFFRIMFNSAIPFTKKHMKFLKVVTAIAQDWNRKHIRKAIRRYSKEKKIAAREIKTLCLIDRLAKEKECF